MKILSTFFAFMLLSSLSFGQCFPGDSQISNMQASIVETSEDYADVTVSFDAYIDHSKTSAPNDPKGTKNNKQDTHNVEVRVGGQLFHVAYISGQASVATTFTVPTSLFETSVANGYTGYVQCGSRIGDNTTYNYDGCIVIVEPCDC